MSSPPPIIPIVALPGRVSAPETFTNPSIAKTAPPIRRGIHRTSRSLPNVLSKRPPTTETTKQVGKKYKIERLCTKRLFNYKYYERLHTSGSIGENRVHWMNTVRLRRSDLITAYSRRDPTLQKRSREYYALGMSIGEILAQNGSNIRSLLEQMRQLMYEYDHCYHSKTQNISLMMATDRGLFPTGNVSNSNNSSSTASTTTNSFSTTRNNTNNNTNTTTNSTTPNLYKMYNKPLYLNLDTSLCPGDGINYIEVVLSLCAILSQLYERIFTSALQISNIGLSEMLLSIDTTITKRVVSVIANDLHDVAIDLLRTQQNAIASLFDSELLVPTLFAK